MVFLKSGENVKLKSSKITTLLSGTLIAYAITMILLFVFSVIVTYTNINEDFTIYIAKAITYIATFVSGFIAAGKIANKGWLSGAIAGLCYAVILVILSSIFGENTFGISDILRFFGCIFTGILGGIIGINIKS